VDQKTFSIFGNDYFFRSHRHRNDLAELLDSVFRYLFGPDREDRLGENKPERLENGWG